VPVKREFISVLTGFFVFDMKGGQVLLKNTKRTLIIELRGKMSQTEFAETLGVSQQAVSAIETGVMTPSIVIMKKYELFFKKPMEELFPDVFENIELEG
jgi:DNA-binding XRE family transcriptional regulator